MAKVFDSEMIRAMCLAILVPGSLFGGAYLIGQSVKGCNSSSQAEAQEKENNTSAASVRSDSQSQPQSETYHPTDSYGMEQQRQASLREANRHWDEERAQENRNEALRKERERRELENRDYNHHVSGSGWIN